MNSKTKIIIPHRLNINNLITISISTFIILFFLPITITISDLIRKPLLILGIGAFALSLTLMGLKYIVTYAVIIIILSIYCVSTWGEYVSTFSYMFATFVSIESLMLSVLIIDGKVKISKRTVYFLIFIAVITALTTIFGLRTYPMAVRELGQGANAENTPIFFMYRKRNIAGWGLLYGIAFLEGSIIYLYKKRSNLCYLIAIIMIAVCVFFSQITFAILITMVSAFLVYINDKDQKMIWRVVPLFVLAIFLWVERENVLMGLYNLVGMNSDLDKLQLRVKNLYDLLVLKNTEGDAGARFELYTMSFNSLLKHPLGLFIEGKTGTNNIGFHSGFFDFIGAMGIVGVICVILLVHILIKNVRKIGDGYNRRFLLIMYATFFTLFILNPVLSNSYIWMTTILLPSVIVMNNWSDKDVRESEIF